ncbi:zinc finger BED domain-containing protein RICESLEEPER 2 [Tanacetum coccineum]
MATQSSSTTTGVGSSSAPTIIEVLPCSQNLAIWQNFNLVKMSDDTTKAQCKLCFHFLSALSNSTWKAHINNKYCETLKLVLEASQSSMAQDGVELLIELITTDLECFHDDLATKEKRTVQQIFGRESDVSIATSVKRKFQQTVLSRMAQDILSVQATAVASESAFSTSGRVLSIRRTRLTPTSLEMCICLKDHLDATDQIQHTLNLENALDFEEWIFDEEVLANEAISLPMKKSH